jgi:FkbM family methyltransferase
MYLVGVINKISRDVLNAPAIAQSGPSIVRILGLWAIPRFTLMRRSSSPNLMPCVTSSPSQMGQDALAVLLCGAGESRFFIEAGACDGVYCSNTWLLEREYNWTGILCEPARVWHENLLSNRKSVIERRALWGESGKLLRFRETQLPNLSTVDDFVERDMHSHSRKEGQVYEVESISLFDLLEAHSAPRYIDFLSLDTEGTEIQILKSFPFDTYSFGLIVCEHNNTDSHEQIVRLLVENDYTHLSELMPISLGDAWFVGPRLSDRLNQLRCSRY